MTAINVAQAKENIYQLITEVNNTSMPVTITNSRGRNAVLISEDDWNAIQETLYLMSVPGMVDSIREGGETPIEECLSENEVAW